LYIDTKDSSFKIKKKLKRYKFSIYFYFLVKKKLKQIENLYWVAPFGLYSKKLATLHLTAVNFFMIEVFEIELKKLIAYKYVCSSHVTTIGYIGNSV